VTRTGGACPSSAYDGFHRPGLDPPKKARTDEHGGELTMTEGWRGEGAKIRTQGSWLIREARADGGRKKKIKSFEKCRDSV